jgi:holo-[acyl-carrier protein] synthase
MSIIGIGTDIVEISRIKKQLNKSDIHFAENLLTCFELAEYEICKQKEHFIAKRFAAKEAAVKALGTGIALGVSFKHIEIRHDILGKPIMKFYGEVESILRLKQVNSVHLSISDEIHYATAIVIFEKIHI